VVEECEFLLRAGCSVVSTCEEMVYPLHTRPDLVARLDAAGKAGRAACLGVGINPGFVLDFLPIALTAPVARVTAVRAFRVVDAAKRRGPLQKKVGAGLTRAEFADKVEAGGFGHRGMLESLHLLCDGFGVPVAGAFTTIEPVLAERKIETDVVAVEPGRVAGLHQTAASADARVKLDLKMYVGAADPGDRVEIDGTPDVRCHVEGGYHGDVATCAITLNAIDAVLGAAPGFHTMLDVAVPRAPVA
jgi:4-hydroxy-tetrahydrodipicolinate reductase